MVLVLLLVHLHLTAAATPPWYGTRARYYVVSRLSGKLITSEKHKGNNLKKKHLSDACSWDKEPRV